MQFHYALVDDLLTREEFERRVEEKIEECGDLVDEPAACMLVVTELGRHHVKISGLTARSSLFSFFGKVISKAEPREFRRRDGETGIVASLVVGDETGQARIILWEDRALMIGEIEIGDVLEIIGRPSGRQREITALAMRKASCEIECSPNSSLREPSQAERTDLEAVIVTKAARPYTRKDGSPGEMTEGVLGDSAGTARYVCWNPELLEGIAPGTSVKVTGAARKDREDRKGREYSFDDGTAITVLQGPPIAIPFAPVAEVNGEGPWSVRGEAVWVSPVREFRSKDGRVSHVRNITLRDRSGSIRLVAWGEHALRHVFPDEVLAAYNVTMKPGRDGTREIHAGRGAAIVAETPGEPVPVTFTGTILTGKDGTFIDDGTTYYAIGTDLPHGKVVRVTGTLKGHTIVPDSVEAVDLGVDELRAEIERFLGEPGGGV